MNSNARKKDFFCDYRIFSAQDTTMNSLIATLYVVDRRIPQDKQQCLLKASKEAREHLSKPQKPTDDHRKVVCSRVLGPIPVQRCLVLNK